MNLLALLVIVFLSPLVLILLANRGSQWFHWLANHLRSWATRFRQSRIFSHCLYWLNNVWDEWLYRWLLYVFLTVCALVLAQWILLDFPENQVKQFPTLEDKEKAKLINEYRRTIAQILGGLAVIIGLFLTWKRIQATEEGQITERFTRAIDQLGSENIHVRLGGIYALQRISNDSPVDYVTTIEVLTAFIRERAPWPPPEVKTKEWSILLPSDFVHTQVPNAIDIDQSSREKQKPATDIQAVLNVLGRRYTTKRVGKEAASILDLSCTDFRGAVLKRANLSGANLSFTNLTKADLSGANLTKADLSGANLTEANLYQAVLSEADLREANLSKADLSFANLNETKLQKAKLTEKANLSSANLSKANLSDANLSGADLTGANLSNALLFNADLSGADLSLANLSYAKLCGVDLSNAFLLSVSLNEATLFASDLSGAKLHEAVLSGTDLGVANLSQADLSRARDLTQLQIDRAFYCERSFPPKLPAIPANLKFPPKQKCDEKGRRL